MEASLISTHGESPKSSFNCQVKMYLICSSAYVLRYKETFHRLRTLKTEIEHLQHLLEKAKVKLMKDFELWWAEQAALLQVISVMIQFFGLLSHGK